MRSTSQAFSRQRILIFLLAASCILLFAGIFYIRLRLDENLHDFQDAYHTLAEYNEAGQLLRSGSDILTNAVRKYAVTKKTIHRDAYFQEAKTDQHRELSLQKISHLPDSADIKRKFHAAMDSSLALMNKEYHAMRLLATSQDLDSPECPPEVKGFSLPEAELRMAYDARVELARGLLFGDEYEEDKNNIYRPIEQAFDKATLNLEERCKLLSTQYSVLHLIQGIGMFAFAVAFAALMICLRLRQGRANALLRNVLNNLPLLFAIKDARTGEYRDCNASFLAFAGKSSLDDFRGRTDDELFPPDTFQALDSIDAKTVASTTPVTSRCTITSADGKPHRFQITQFQIADQDGSPCIFGMASDVTENEELNANAGAIAKALLVLQAESAVNSPRQVLDIIRERLDADFGHLIRHDHEQDTYVIDSEHSIDRFGNSLPHTFSCPAAPIRQLLDQPAPGGHFILEGEPLALFRKTLFDDAPALHPTTTLAAIPVQVAGQAWGILLVGFNTPHRLNKYEQDFLGRCSEIFGATLERHLNSQRLHSALDQAVAAEKARTLFFSTVSHDIRTPLNAILGYAELMKYGIDKEEERKKALNAITTSGDTLLQLINDVLDLSKLESGKMDIAPVPTDLAKLASGVLHSFDVAVSGGEVKLHEDMETLPLLEVDPQRIRQILFNLISNAVKFTDHGSITLHADFQPDAENADYGVLTLAVADTGAGIAEEDQKHLMQPFTQLRTPKASRGTGLGLSICRQLAKRMNGTLTLKSAPGKGSVFTLTLQNVKTIPLAAIPAPDAPDAPREINGQDLRILVADDVPVNLAVIKAMLKRLQVGHFETASDGLAALQRLQADPDFDLVLTDMWMPNMTGEELVQAIRKDPRLASIPVYAVTADVEARKHSEEMGFTGIVLKPVTLDKLTQLLANITPHEARGK